MSWIIYSVIGALCLSLHFLSITKLTRLGLPVSFVNVVVYALSTACLFVYYLLNKKQVTLESTHIPWVILASASSFFLITVTLQAFKLAPNPGYVNAIQNLSTIIVTISSVFLLSASLSPMKVAGVLLAVAGIIIVSLSA